MKKRLFVTKKIKIFQYGLTANNTFVENDLNYTKFDNMPILMVDDSMFNDKGEFIEHMNDHKDNDARIIGSVLGNCQSVGNELYAFALIWDECLDEKGNFNKEFFNYVIEVDKNLEEKDGVKIIKDFIPKEIYYK